MSEIKVTMPSGGSLKSTPTEEPIALCAGLFQLEKDLKAYVDDVIDFNIGGEIEIITLKDVLIDGNSIVSDKVAHIPKSTSEDFGVVKIIKYEDGSCRFVVGDGNFAVPMLLGETNQIQLSRNFIPKATTTQLGAVIAGDNITIDDNGRISAVAEQQEFLTISELDAILI